MVRRPAATKDPASPVGVAPNGAKAKSGLNRSINDAGWGELLSRISYKAESAGRIVVKVNPHYTSKRCWACGHVARSNWVSQAVFRCQRCGHEDHADVNAARNILGAGRAQLVAASNGPN